MRILDQSFSAENFRKIFDYENRKGAYLENRFSEDLAFGNIQNITKEIKICNNDIKNCLLEIKAIRKRTNDPQELKKMITEQQEKINNLNLTKKNLQSNKESFICNALKCVSDRVSSRGFEINLSKREVIDEKGKVKYQYLVNDLPENYFVLKKIQHSLRRLYKVKQANRFEIVSQLKCLLNDGFPKHVVRADIKHFYESINNDILIHKIQKDNLLNFLSKKIIKKILSDYKSLSSSEIGVPRGIGVSAYLVEIYMRDIDEKIRNLPNLIYYARYVDDIIAIFTHSSSRQKINHETQVTDIIQLEKYGLKVNDKTKTLDITLKPNNLFIEYLGYVISFSESSVNFKLGTQKKERYSKRIDAAIESYKSSSIANEKKARKLLINRLKFLTGNSRLLGNKNVLIGSYYSNSLLSSMSCFKSSDKNLRNKIKELVKSDTKNRLCKLEEQTKTLTFTRGFRNKTFFPFSQTQLTEITKIWQNGTK
jgi:hypothetical protein